MSERPRLRVPARRVPPRVVIRLLGTFELNIDDGAVALPTGTQRLVAVLALRGRTGRSRLAGLLWPETTEHRALASLRTGIWRVNQAAPGLVTSTQGVVDLGLETDIDVRRLIAASRAALEATAAPLEGVDVGDGGGELLPDWDDDWLDADRERLRQLRLHVLEAAAEHLAATGRFGLALESALAALRADSLRESAHRAVIRIHLAEGNVSEARKAYDQCARILRTDVGVGPSQATEALLPGPRRADSPAH